MHIIFGGVTDILTDTLSKMINFYGMQQHSRINLNSTPPNILLSTIHKMAVFT